MRLTLNSIRSLANVADNCLLATERSQAIIYYLLILDVIEGKTKE